MSRKDIEVLIIWLIFALLVKSVAAPLLLEYSKAIIDSTAPSIAYGLSKGQLVLLSVYLSYLAQLLVNLVIAFWVFKTIKSKKFLWVVFSLLAGWWVLPLLIFYQYFAEETRKES